MVTNLREVYTTIEAELEGRLYKTIWWLKKSSVEHFRQNKFTSKCVQSIRDTADSELVGTLKKACDKVGEAKWNLKLKTLEHENEKYELSAIDNSVYLIYHQLITV